jgi:hypothetical protein
MWSNICVRLHYLSYGTLEKICDRFILSSFEFVLVHYEKKFARRIIQAFENVVERIKIQMNSI